MTRHPSFGLLLAACGAILLSPDALFMRLSGMDGMQMLGWRGLCMGTLFLCLWALTSASRRVDLRALATGAGLTVAASQWINAMLFPTGIAAAPVAVVLIAIATVPVWAAVLSRLLYGERTSTATWVTIALVLAGITLAVSGQGDAALNPRALIGAACGLGVALTLALSFVTLRHSPGIPILLAVGLGALCAGLTGLTLTTPARMTDGTLWAILVAAVLILPASFFALSTASRHTAAANVSLLMLLETVLGPLWVWLGTGEAPTLRMMAGGAIVVITLAIYIAANDRAARRRRRVTI
jgi:drug/metabolite transporter (DMT)-like permease